jgi:phosphoribosyl-AMP cyclohydrolase
MEASKNKLEEGSELNLQFKKRGGILPVAVQESSTGRILMIASVNQEALRYTLENRQAAFWSTSRSELWVKGLTSGNTLYLDEILVDCDQDALIYKVTLEGDGACHTKNNTGVHRKACFYRSLDLNSGLLKYVADDKK